jgi:parallel beta-helix repeat protein
MYKILLLAIMVMVLFGLSCKKDSVITSPNAQINFSSDTIAFDTVFTSVGSVTQSVKIFNPNNQKLILSQVRLAGGISSSFKINIDGAPGPDASNIELDANDSLYIFVTVFVNPTAANLAFILQDSIQVSFNGNQQFIQLRAWGQNAHFLQNQFISSNTSWTNDLPYVILGGLQVDSGAVLTVLPGCKIYLHADAAFIIEGSLQTQGQKYDSSRIYFQGDRLDYPYNGFPASWPGIYFTGSSKDNLLEYTVIKNANEGVVITGSSSDANPKLVLNECILDNIYDAAILATQTSIQARNCLVTNSGRNIVVDYGGNYSFTHCTVSSFSNDYIAHLSPVLNISNYEIQGNIPVESDLTANFINCIFWGDFGTVSDEVVVSKQGNTIFMVGFQNCLWKFTNQPAGVDSSNMITNLDPLFDSVNNQQRIYDFHLKATSPAINKGINTGILFDLDGNPRAVGLPDLGCFENQ